MQASDWATFIWYSLLIVTFLLAVIWIVCESRKKKGRLRESLGKTGNWIKIACGRMAAEVKKLFTRSGKKREMELEQQRKAEEYRKKALLRYVCPVFKHRLLCVPAVPPADECEGTKYYCLSCGYERIEKEEE